jgi:hypothetical protein
MRADEGYGGGRGGFRDDRGGGGGGGYREERGGERGAQRICCAGVVKGFAAACAVLSCVVVSGGVTPQAAWYD